MRTIRAQSCGLPVARHSVYTNAPGGVVTVRAVERHINAIFSKLGLAEEADVHRRVGAVLVYLADQR